MLFPLVIGPGLNTDDTVFLNHPGRSLTPQPGYLDMDKSRFWRGQPQTIGGWELFVSTSLTGVCRAIQPWDDLSGTLNVAFGTNSKLEVYYGGSLFDITPTLALPSLVLGTNPLTTTGAGSPNVTFTWKGHPLTTSDTLNVTGATAVGGITPNGGPFSVVAVTTDTVTFAFSSNAASGATGGGSAVGIAPQRAFVGGAVDGTGGAGFSTGTYSSGGYSQPSTMAYYPATWSLSNFGQTLIANFRGGTIHLWTNNTAVAAVPLPNAPVQVTYALVAPQRQVIALGCNEVTSGVYDPMNARGSDLEDPTTWVPTTANNAWEEKLEGGARLVAGHFAGDQMFVWSDTCLWQAQFIGDPGQTWRFTRLGEDCGLIGPNAAEVVGQSAFWLSPDGNFRTCPLGGEPKLIISPVAQELLANLSPGQQDKIIAAHVPQFGEVWWFYPDARDGTEVSRYVAVSIDTGTWFHGTFDRTAFCHGGPAAYPIGVSAGGSAYYHEKGRSADGGPIAWFWETGGQYIGNADQRVLIRALIPDFKDQVGSVQATVYMRDYPQSVDRAKGPFTLTPGQEKRSFLADGRIARVRVAGNTTPSFCRQGLLQLEGDGSGMQ